MSETVTSRSFSHRLFYPAGAPAEISRLHVYIEGDGRPWRTRELIATDPTSPTSTLLQAMLLDPAPAVFLGRPCYYQVPDPACSGRWWTTHRYHNRVVASMAEIVEELAAEVDELWLIGHSGGGTLAVLVGRRLSRPVKVVTVAANLDHAAWTDYHDYYPLTDSLNPVDETGRNPALTELHWYGSGDTNILPRWIRAYCRETGATCRAANAHHTQGWLEQWPAILERSEEILNENE